MENYKEKTPRVGGMLAKDRPISRMGDSLSTELARFLLNWAKYAKQGLGWR